MANDALLSLSGPSNAPGNAVEAAGITADADGGKGYKFVGKNRVGFLECRISGAHDRTSGDEVIAFEVHEAADNAGTNAVLIATSANLTSSMAATNVNSSTGPVRVGFTTTNLGGWVKARYNVGGTTPNSLNVSADIQMTGIAVIASGT
jgi:hypothetical protein